MSDEPPEYTTEPVAVPLVGLAQVATGTYIEQSKELSVKLFNQKPKEKAGVLPTYGRGDSVKGEIGILAKPDKVEKVVLKLEGHVKLDVFDGSPSKEEVLSSEHVLYTKGSSKCPPKLDFDITIPTEADVGHVLPPTYETPGKDTSSLYSKISYRIVVSLSMKRMLGSGDKSVIIDVDYCPRTSPPMQSIQTYENFNPADSWEKTTREVQLKPGASSDVQPLTCNLYIPSSRTFGMTQSIPFHITLSGPAPTMQEFLPPSYDAAAPQDKAKKGFTPVKLKVSLTRKITIKPTSKASSNEESRETNIGEASVLPLGSSVGEDGVTTVEYGGEISPSNNTIKTGSLEANGLSLKDYLILNVNPENSGLTRKKIAVPVRLVTDAWLDTHQANAAKSSAKLKGAAIYGFAWGGGF